MEAIKITASKVGDALVIRIDVSDEIKSIVLAGGRPVAADPAPPAADVTARQGDGLPADYNTRRAVAVGKLRKLKINNPERIVSEFGPEEVWRVAMAINWKDPKITNPGGYLFTVLRRGGRV